MHIRFFQNYFKGLGIINKSCCSLTWEDYFAFQSYYQANNHFLCPLYIKSTIYKQHQRCKRSSCELSNWCFDSKSISYEFKLNMRRIKRFSYRRMTHTLWSIQWDKLFSFLCSIKSWLNKVLRCHKSFQLQSHCLLIDRKRSRWIGWWLICILLPLLLKYYQWLVQRAPWSSTLDIHFDDKSQQEWVNSMIWVLRKLCSLKQFVCRMRWQALTRSLQIVELNSF